MDVTRLFVVLVDRATLSALTEPGKLAEHLAAQSLTAKDFVEINVLGRAGYHLVPATTAFDPSSLRSVAVPDPGPRAPDDTIRVIREILNTQATISADGYRHCTTILSFVTDDDQRIAEDLGRLGTIIDLGSVIAPPSTVTTRESTGILLSRVGAALSGRYRLQRLIATGGMGQVWEAVDSRLGRRVAIKVLKAEYSTDPEFVERFRAEARTVAMLNHPGIASVYDYGETDMDGEGRTAYLVMELVNGEPLNSVLKRTGRLSLRHALDMLEQTGRALQVAHTAGLVHRDVKPGNILISPTGQVKLTDFGIAKAVDAAPVTQTGMVMGTAQYIAPEQALGHDATAASDVYALGVVGYESVAGRRPFTGDGALTVAMKHIKETPPPLPADLPPNVRELIEITLVKNPGMRYRSGGPFADAVAAVRSGRRPPRPNQAPSDAPTPAAADMTSEAPAAGAASLDERPPWQRSRAVTGTHRPDPPQRPFSASQRALLLWAGGVLGAMVIVIAILIVLGA